MTSKQTIELNPNQHAVLTHAVEHNQGKITWFPDHIKGGARQKVLAGLFNRALITSNGTDHLVAAEGYDALGLARPTAALMLEVAPLVAEPQLEATVASVKPGLAQETQTPTPEATPTVHHTREHSKQATIIEMLKRTEGATIDQIIEATGWQAHTVRGTFAGAFKKKLGLSITSDKTQGQQRVYRIAA